jgi:hypothetical protein
MLAMRTFVPNNFIWWWSSFGLRFFLWRLCSCFCFRLFFSSYSDLVYRQRKPCCWIVVKSIWVSIGDLKSWGEDLKRCRKTRMNF